ncbi:Fur family transcriptional regulator [Pseudoxanthomonas winnipegensis]|uniref:Fur family transcriptional regulator n=1 Tax=Pseudoxanthomonas winnipegensis TaxID=2480810 RepID=UPI003F833451
MATDAYHAALQSAGLRLTAPRRALLELLAQQPVACDAMSLHQQLRGQGRRVSLGTVYRLLRVLEDRQLAIAIASPHGRTLWRLCQPAPSAPFDAVATSVWLRSLAAELGYRLVPLH